MMSIMIAISVQTIRYCPIVQPTVMDIVNIRAAEWSAKTVHTWRSVPQSKDHVKVVTRHIWGAIPGNV